MAATWRRRFNSPCSAAAMMAVATSCAAVIRYFFCSVTKYVRSSDSLARFVDGVQVGDCAL